LILLVAAAAAISSFSPQTACAENITLVRTASLSQNTLASPQKRARLGVDSDGNVMVRYGGVSVTFIYDAASAAKDSREFASASAQRQEVASLGGLSVKLGVAF